MADTLEDLALRQQVLIERVKSATVNDLADILNEANRLTVQLLKAREEAKLNELTRVQIEQLLATVRRIQEGAADQYVTALTTQLHAIAGTAAGQEAGLIAGAIVAGSAADALRAMADARGLAADAYKLAASTPITATGSMLDAFVAGWKRGHVDQVEAVIRRAWATGMTLNDTVTEITGTASARRTDGQAARALRDAEAVVRTATQHVATLSREYVWRSNADIVEGWQFKATLDSRTTSQCRSLDMRKFSVGEGPRPPLHIRCRSTAVPVLAPEFDALAGGGTRSAEFGPVADDVTYYAWLKTQPDKFQDIAIGPQRAKLLRDGGLSADKFAALNLGRNFEPLTLDEMRRLAPAAFERAGI